MMVGRCVQVTSDSCFLILGHTFSFGAGDDIWLIKTDLNGNTLWTKTFGLVSGGCVIETSDSKYVIVGEKDGNVYLLKTNSMGDSLWSKTYNFNLNDGYGTCIIETTDGYIITVDSNDGIVFKTNFSGDTLWTNRILLGNPNLYHSCRSVTETINGDYLVGSTSVGFSGNDPPYYYGKISLINDIGNVLWMKDICNGWDAQLNSVIQTSDSCYITTGAAQIPWGAAIFLAKVASSTTSLKVSRYPIIQDYKTTVVYRTPGYRERRLT